VTSSAAEPQTVERWDGTVTFGKLKLPFSMQFRVDGATATAVFRNLGEGTLPNAAASGSVARETVRLDFKASGAIIEARLDGGSLKGHFITSQGVRHVLEAGRYCTCGFEGEAGPDISGEWSLDGGKRRLTVQRKGEETFARLNNSGPALAGRFDGAVFTLAYFNGDPANAGWLEMEPAKDGKSMLLVWQKPGESPVKWTASKP